MRHFFKSTREFISLKKSSLLRDPLWRAQAPEPSPGHDGNPVAESLALLHRVGGEDDGAAAHAHLAAEEAPHAALGQDVHAAENFF